MRVEGYDLQELPGAGWLLSTKRSGRTAAAVAACIFLSIAAIVAQQSGGRYAPALVVCGLLGLLTLISAMSCERIMLAPDAIGYSRSFPLRASKELSVDSLESINFGPVDLLVGNRRCPAYRVWLDFRNDELPRSVLFERTLKQDPEASGAAKALAEKLAASLGRQARKVEPGGGNHTA